MMEEAVIAENPDFLFIFFGANDSVEETVLQHVPLNEYSKNIREIIVKARKVSNYRHKLYILSFICSQSIV